MKGRNLIHFPYHAFPCDASSINSKGPFIDLSRDIGTGFNVGNCNFKSSIHQEIDCNYSLDLINEIYEIELHYGDCELSWWEMSLSLGVSYRIDCLWEFIIEWFCKGS